MRSYMVTDYGKSFSSRVCRVFKWFDQAELRHCTAHAVRKGLATNLAESEAADSMLDGLFGWKDGKTSNLHRSQTAGEVRRAGRFTHRLG